MRSCGFCTLLNESFQSTVRMCGFANSRETSYARRGGRLLVLPRSRSLMSIGPAYLFYSCSMLMCTGEAMRRGIRRASGPFISHANLGAKFMNPRRRCGTQLATLSCDRTGVECESRGRLRLEPRAGAHLRAPEINQ